MADHILIKDLECFAYHGVLEAEQQLGQKFLVSLDLQMDTRKAGQTDALDASINYASVCQDVISFMKEQRFALIEAVAEQLAEQLLLHYQLLEVIQIEIKKPLGTGHVTVRYSSCADCPKVAQSVSWYWF